MPISDESSLNAAVGITAAAARIGARLTISSLKSATRFTKWLYAKNKQLQADKTNQLLSDACSAFRGGIISNPENPELKKLMYSFAGTEDSRLDGTFFFTGDRTDLSIFWRKQNADGDSKINKNVISDIPDEDLRKRVMSAFTEAEFNNYIKNEGDYFSVTGKGKEHITSPEFVKERLKKECQFLGITDSVFDKIKEAADNDRIDALLKEKGLTDKYTDTQRITLNKERLYISQGEDGTLFYIPGTRRKEKIVIPKDDVLELDDKTFVGFLRKDKKYVVFSDEGGRQLRGVDDLMKKFDDKNKNRYTYEAAQKAGEKMTLVDETRNGEIWNVFDRAGNPHEYEIMQSIIDENGNVYFHMAGAKDQPEILLPEYQLGRTCFTTPEQGKEAMAQDPEIFDKYAAELDPFLIYDKQQTFVVKQGYFTETENGYSVAVGGRKDSFNHIYIPKGNAEIKDGNLIVTLRDSEYVQQIGRYSAVAPKEIAAEEFKHSGKSIVSETKIKVTKEISAAAEKGEKDVKLNRMSAVSGSKTVAGATAKAGEKTAEGTTKVGEKTAGAAAKTGEKTAETAVKAGEKAVEKAVEAGAETAAKIITEKAVDTAVTAASTAADTGVQTAASAIPPVEGITATTRAVLQVGSKVAKTSVQVGTKVASATLSASRTLSKNG